MIPSKWKVYAIKYLNWESKIYNKYKYKKII